MEEAKADDQETMIRVRRERSTSTNAIIIDYDKFMEMYNVDFRRSDSLPQASEANQDTASKQQDGSGDSVGQSSTPSDKQMPPLGKIPFSETDAGGKGNVPF